MSEHETGEGESLRREPVFNLPTIISVLLAVMFVVQLLMVVGGPELQLYIVYVFGFVPARYAEGGLEFFPGGVLGLVWPFFTHAFIHGNWVHFIFNALWLMAVGTPLARRLGALPFCVFYFGCGAVGALAHLVTNLGSEVPVVGASGAIAGCMAGAVRIMFSPTARYFIRKTPALGTLAPITERRILFFTAVWVILNVVMGSGFMPMPGQGEAGVAWQAHIGGFIAGLFLISLVDRWAQGATRIFPRL